MSKIDDILFEFASNFAQYHDEDKDQGEEPYWWGHDTNLGKQTAAFTKAKKAINKYKREQLPMDFKGSPLAEIPIAKRKVIAEAIFGKAKVPAYWHGSRGEYDALYTLARVKGAFKQ